MPFGLSPSASSGQAARSEVEGRSVARASTSPLPRLRSARTDIGYMQMKTPLIAGSGALTIHTSVAALTFAAFVTPPAQPAAALSRPRCIPTLPESPPYARLAAGQECAPALAYERASLEYQ